MTGPVWIPSQAAAGASNVERYRHWLSTHRGLDLPDHAALHAWSVAEPARFWGSPLGVLRHPRHAVRAGAGVRGDARRAVVTGGRRNYVDQVFRHLRDGVGVDTGESETAIIDEPEPGRRDGA